MTSPYCDYQFYTDVYLGNSITEGDFPRLELRAEDYLNVITFHRLPSMEADDDLTLLVGKTVCAMAETYANLLPDYNAGVAAANSGISSENLDGYAVVYGKSDITADKLNIAQAASMKYVAMQYLGDSGLLYRGGGDWHDQ